MKKLILYLIAPFALMAEARYPLEPLPEALISKAKTYTFSVILEPLHLTVINSEVNTPVLKIYKRMGESFAEDEILMELQSPVYESNYVKAETAVTKFTTELAAKKRLYADDALSQFELDDTMASLAGAEADLALAKKLLDSTKIKGPYHGKVVKVSVKEFELAQQNKELITLVEDTFLFAKFLVPSSLWNCLRIGMPADLYIKETGVKVSTTISRIAPLIDPSSATIMVEAKIDNQEGRLVAGMSGRIILKDCQ